MLGSLKFYVNDIICIKCKHTEHDCNITFMDHPRLLFLVIKRYSFENNQTNMILDPINVLHDMIIDNVKYELLAVVHHHRSKDGSTGSKHYTCTVKYLDYFHINDSIVETHKSNELNNSRTAYLVIYRRIGHVGYTHAM